MFLFCFVCLFVLLFRFFFLAVFFKDWIFKKTHFKTSDNKENTPPPQKKGENFMKYLFKVNNTLNYYLLFFPFLYAVAIYQVGCFKELRWMEVNFIDKIFKLSTQHIFKIKDAIRDKPTKPSLVSTIII